MKTIFTGDKLDELKKVAESWVGAKYEHMGTSRGGVDCTKLMALILIDLQLLQKIEPSYYGRDWAENSDVEIMLTAFYKHLVKYLAPGYDSVILKYKPGIELLDGDIIAFCTGTNGLCSHAGMIIDHRLFHTIWGADTGYTWMSQHWQDKARFIFRITKC